MIEEKLLELIGSIRPANAEVSALARERLDSLTKPPGSLGKLEEIAWRLAGIQEKVKPVIGKKRVYTLAGDHGVTAEGVSPYPKEVTPQMVLNFINGGAAISVLTRHAGAEIKVVDIGVDFDFGVEPKLIQKKVRRGTDNFAVGPAMSRKEAVEAIGVGVGLAADAAREGVTLLGVGEMGIGNTTPAAALLSVFTGLAPSECVGRGTGIDDEGLKRKAKVIDKALEVNKPEPSDPIGVLSKVGGLELAGMTGLYLGAAIHRIPVLADGFISCASALAAVRLNPLVRDFLILSHLSEERGHRKLVEALWQQPIMDLSMRLGEGSGAALAMMLVEASAKIISEMATFAEAGVSNKED